MATDTKTAQAAPPGKYDAYIEAQLDKAQKRVRLLDLTAALLGFVAGTLAFATLMVLLDRLFELSLGSRQLALGAFLLGSAIYLAVFVVRPLTWRVNPYYAARQLEKELPGSKNSVVNWIDLREQKLPGVLRGAVGQRAAKDLAHADVERAISGRRTTYVGVVAAILGVVFGAMFFIIGPRPFASLLGRAFVPFAGGTVAKRTDVKVLRPKPENATITIGSPFTIVAEVSGYIPDQSSPRAPHLLYRHAADEPWRDRFLQQDETTREWATTLPSIDVGKGFWYKVVAGDAETPEYRVTVRAAPLLTDFQVTYHYRPYLARGPMISRDRKIEELRGSKAEVLIAANRPIRDGALDLETTDGTRSQLRGERVAGDAQALRFRFVLDRDGHYRVRFTAPDGESYVDVVRYEIHVLLDRPPQVKLTEPGKNVELPANGRLKLKGEASDDHGVEALTLRMQVVGGPKRGQKLRAQPYLSPEKMRLPGGGNPRKVDYQDVVELAELRQIDGQPADLQVGDEVEYWLEARDGCDYPKANVSESSPRYRVKLLEPTKNAEQEKKEREQAREEQKKHEQKQEADRNKEGEQREQERRDQKERNKEEERKSQQARKDGQKPKDGREDEKSKDRKGDSSKEQKGGKSGESPAKDKKTEEMARKLKNEGNKREQDKQEQEEQAKEKGEGKNGNSQAGKGKPGAEKKASPEREGDKKRAGEGRGKGKSGDEKPGECKECGKEGGSEGASSARSSPPDGAGKEETPKGAGKEGTASEERQRPGTGRGGENAEKKTEPSKGRSGGSREERARSGESKPQEDGTPQKQGERGAGRGRGEERAKKETEGGGTAGPEPMAKPEGKGGEGADELEKTGKGKSNSPREDGANHAKGRQAPKKGEGAPNGKGKEGDREKTKEEIAQERKALKEAVREAKEKGPGKGLSKAEERQVKEYLKNLEKRLNDPDKKVRDKAEKEARALKDALQQDKECEACKGRGKGKKVGKPGKGKDSKEGEGTPGKAKGKGESPPKGKDKGEPGGQTRDPGKGPPTGPRFVRELAGRAPPPKAEKPGEHRASMLQLEKFKNIDPDILKSRGISPEEWQKFLKDYERIARRNEAAAREDKLRPSRGGNDLTSTGGRLGPTGKGRPEDLKSDGRGKPPPGYRDSYADFLRKLTEPE
jgi:hypothetical protein